MTFLKLVIFVCSGKCAHCGNNVKKAIALTSAEVEELSEAYKERVFVKHGDIFLGSNPTVRIIRRCQHVISVFKFLSDVNNRFCSTSDGVTLNICVFKNWTAKITEKN